jgi:hypothetical protein
LGRTFFETKHNELSDGTGLSDLTSSGPQVPAKMEPVSSGVTEAKTPTGQPIGPVRSSNALAHGNAIVIQEFHTLADLIPVGRFFKAEGIATEIVSKGSTYFLITKERFPYNPEATHTRGNALLQEIRSKGQDYKAPQGLEPFAPNKFKGAYGRNIDEQYIGEVTDVP